MPLDAVEASFSARHFITTSVSGSGTGSDRSRIDSMKL